MTEESLKTGTDILADIKIWEVRLKDIQEVKTFDFARMRLNITKNISPREKFSRNIAVFRDNCISECQHNISKLKKQFDLLK